MAKMLVISKGETLWELKSLELATFDVKTRQKSAVSKVEMGRNMLNWPLETVVLWYCAQNHIFNGGVWNLGQAHHILRTSEEESGDQQWVKRKLIRHIRREDLHRVKRAAVRNLRIRKSSPKPRKPRLRKQNPNIPEMAKVARTFLNR
jgi:hypothetical protein